MKTIAKTALGRSVSTHLGRYIKNERGNMSVLFALSAMTLVAAVGTALDYSQMASDVQKAQASADAAVLAAAHEYYIDFRSEDSVLSGQTSAKRHMITETATGEHEVETTITPNGRNSFELVSSISGTTRHPFMRMFGNNETDWTVSAYSEISVPRIEIILVVDVSASMQGEKIDALKAALRKFVEDVKPFRKGETYVSVSMIPFAENINFGIGSSTWLDRDPNADDAIIFEGCFISDEWDRPGSMLSYDLTVRKNGFYLCPPHGSKTVLFSTESAPLNLAIATLGLSWGTDTELGLIWAERFLTNYWRENARTFAAEHPIPVTPETEKVVVLLTDGALAVTDNNQDGIADSGRTIRKRKGANIREFNLQCNKMEAEIENLHMYTVGFQLSDGPMKNTLRNCTAGKGTYAAATTSDLDAVFRKITDSLTAIRLTR